MVKILKASLLGLATFTVLGCEQFSTQSPKVSEMVANSVGAYRLEQTPVRKSLLFLTDAPHPMNSPRQQEVRDYIVKELQALNLESSVQSFTAPTPNKDAELMLAPPTISKQGFNLTARLKLVEHPSCVVALSSHYDTKDIANFPYVGANDSASSSILLLDLARFLMNVKDSLKLRCDIQLIWFDGEEATLPDWNQGLQQHPAHIVDNTYGSRFFATKLQTCSCSQSVICQTMQDTEVPFLALVLLDMVGYKDLKLTPDQNSHPHLTDLFFEASEFLAKRHLIVGNPQAVVDDHLPLKERGVPVLDIIDFNHLDLWHTPLDRAETVSFDSLEISGKLALFIILSIAEEPAELFASGADACLKNSNSLE